MEDILKPVMRVFTARDFDALKHKYVFTTSTVEKKVINAKSMDVLVLQTQFREGRHWIDNAWILNEESEDVFMELMFGKKVDA